MATDTAPSDPPTTLLHPVATKSPQLQPSAVLEMSPAMEFMAKCCHLLRLKDHVLATAALYFHHYYCHFEALRHSPDRLSGGRLDPAVGLAEFKIDLHTMVITCIQLACKQCEAIRKTRDIINVGHWLVDEVPGNYLKIGEKYHIIRESLISSELCLLRVLNFQTAIRLPHDYIPDICLSTFDLYRNQGKELDATQASVGAIALNLAQDACCCSQFVAQGIPMKAVAMACVYFALRLRQLELPIPPEEWYRMCDTRRSESEPSLKSNVHRSMRILVAFLSTNNHIS
ncbi:uncharacterized protein BJ171DRAFT_516689 [Polychytrium aggregatum]|uniref:uncharacterized protein n=1 Tax=Polychytrium aggregatum TaxID=110093 RepID=UPI0022FDED06|nr:uncharacterized protein BJ171DRAFT_516689 [Polychytrium aggregatum]KAI9201834.1 hypothetical protein BJ171DRAFT_516689 [Polychytrium aggregatum]